MPTQASSEFITNKQQGDWAEDVIFRAINNYSENVVAVHYGKSDDLVAGDKGFEDFYNKYQQELDSIGKRPDILLFKKEDYDSRLGDDISKYDSSEMTYGVPHFYVQVFFDKVYGISFHHILELISNPHLEGEKFFVEQDSKNQNKTTIKIPSLDGICLAETVKEPDHHSVRKELNKGRLLFYVKFDGGAAYLDKQCFDQLFGCDL